MFRNEVSLENNNISSRCQLRNKGIRRCIHRMFIYGITTGVHKTYPVSIINCIQVPKDDRNRLLSTRENRLVEDSMKSKNTLIRFCALLQVSCCLVSAQVLWAYQHQCVLFCTTAMQVSEQMKQRAAMSYPARCQVLYVSQPTRSCCAHLES